eukprot:3444649-Karenia_brevis.AAC.1
MHHYLWHCQHPTLKKSRNNDNSPQQDFILQQLDIIPLYMKYGIPQTMTSQLDKPWWHVNGKDEDIDASRMTPDEMMKIGVTAHTLPQQTQ